MNSDKSPKQQTEDIVDRFTIISDGGALAGVAAGSACIVHHPTERQRIKLNAFLGPASEVEAELCAGLIGLSFLQAHRQQVTKIISSVSWHSDHLSTLQGATRYVPLWEANSWRTRGNRTVKNQGLWRCYRHLTDDLEIESFHIRGHSGHKEQEACDRACRWMQRSGEKLLIKHGEGLIGRTRLQTPQHAWLLLDAREFLIRLRKPNPNIADFTLLIRKLLDLGASSFPD